jgi:large subunit ribosomal protein L25
MTETLALTAERRDRAGKGAARATRRDGRIPAVIYGDGQEPLLISLEPRGFVKAHRTLPRDVQLHPVSDQPLHADFMRVSGKTRITVAVPVHFLNQEKAPGLKRGGILNVVRHDLELICTADNIPEFITVDLEGYDIGDSIHISAVTLPEGTRSAIMQRDFTIASIAAPSAVRDEAREAAAAAAAAAATPEAAPGAVVPGAAPAAAGAAPAGGEEKKEKK